MSDPRQFDDALSAHLAGQVHPQPHPQPMSKNADQEKAEWCAPLPKHAAQQRNWRVEWDYQAWDLDFVVVVSCVVASITTLLYVLVRGLT